MSTLFAFLVREPTIGRASPHAVRHQWRPDNTLDHLTWPFADSGARNTLILQGIGVILILH